MVGGWGAVVGGGGRVIVCVLLLAGMMISLPATAQVVRPGADFQTDPGWSKDFKEGMIAIQSQDFVKATLAFQRCVDTAKTPDSNCEFYLAIMHQQSGDLAGYRKWMNTAAAHGNAMALTILDITERFQ